VTTRFVSNETELLTILEKFLPL